MSGPAVGSKQGRVTLPRIQRAIAMRERGMSYPAISAAIEVYEGDAPKPGTIRDYLIAAGLPRKPRGVPLNGVNPR